MAWYHRILNVVRPTALSRDLDREISSHLAERTDDLIASGMDPQEAAYEARRRFGNSAKQKERAHDVDGVVWLENLIADTRYAVRALKMSPGFTTVAVLSLALGIGANTAIFSLTNAVVLRSLPVHNPGELVAVEMGSAASKGKSKTPSTASQAVRLASELTNPIWEQVRDDTTIFAGTLAFATNRFNLANGGEVRRAQGGVVSGSFFGVLGVRAAAGRLLLPSDDTRGCAPVAVLSDGFARREHGSAAAAVGTTLSLDGHPFQVIGVTDPSFGGIEVGQPPDVYVPICSLVITTGRPGVLDQRSRWYLDIVGRVRPGMSSEQLAGRLATFGPRVFAATTPQNLDTRSKEDYASSTLVAVPAAAGFSVLRDAYRKALFTLMVIVGAVLLVACANIANLLLARAAARQREIAIRLAIGVGRWRLTRQLLTESLLLSLAGAALGIVFARWASQLLVGMLSTGARPITLDLTLDVRVLGFTVGLAMLTGIVFGLIPAWRAAHVDPQSTLKAGGRGVVRSGFAHKLGRTLVVGQVALSLLLVAGAALLTGSFRRLLNVDMGFDRGNVMLVHVSYAAATLDGDRIVLAQSEMLRRIRNLPGVTSASASLITPMGNVGWNDAIVAAGYAPEHSAESLAYFNQVSDGYFTTMGTALLAGRDVSAADIAARRSVVVISETMAQKVFGSSAAALGRTFTTAVGPGQGPPREVIGVVKDAKYGRVNEPLRMLAYFPIGVGDTPWTDINFEIRTGASATGIAERVRSLAAADNPALSLEFTTLKTQVDESLSRPRLLATLSGFFGVLALVLAMIGLYGTMAYDVTQRRNEIGIRMALGAGNPRVLRMVVGEATQLIATGVIAGMALALATTRLMSAFLFGVTPTDAGTMAFAAGLLMLIGLAAAFTPAWRAARLDPMSALRDE